MNYIKDYYKYNKLTREEFEYLNDYTNITYNKLSEEFNYICKPNLNIIWDSICNKELLGKNMLFNISIYMKNILNNIPIDIDTNKLSIKFMPVKALIYVTLLHEILHSEQMIYKKPYGIMSNELKSTNDIESEVRWFVKEYVERNICTIKILFDLDDFVLVVAIHQIDDYTEYRKYERCTSYELYVYYPLLFILNPTKHNVKIMDNIISLLYYNKNINVFINSTCFKYRENGKFKIKSIKECANVFILNTNEKAYSFNYKIVKGSKHNPLGADLFIKIKNF